METAWRVCAAAAAVLAAGCFGRKSAEVARGEAAGGWLFAGVNVFDGERALGPRDVLVRGGRVEAVAEPGSLSEAAGITRIDGAGKTLLPGLIDSHAHLESDGGAMWDARLADRAEIARSYLYAGVTTILVLHSVAPEAELADKARRGKALAPRMYLAGPNLTAPGGFPISTYEALAPWFFRSFIRRSFRTASTAEEARAVVDDVAQKLSPEFYKLTCDEMPPGTPKLPREAMVAAISRAKERGMRPVAHIGASEDVLAAAEAGLAIFAHPPSKDLLSEDQIARLKELGVPFVSTLRFLKGHEDVAAGSTPLEREMVDAETLRRMSTPPEDFGMPGFPTVAAISEATARYTADLRENLRRLWRAGVPVFAGSDAGAPGVFPGASLSRELAGLVELGLSPVEALKAATSAPADFLDPAKSYGRVAPGQIADLLLVEGDPTADIADISRVAAVFQAGSRLERRALSAK
jgi:imidazolonepropionase-like amidohydrolase